MFGQNAKEKAEKDVRIGIFKIFNSKGLNVGLKAHDQSYVTDVDHFISDYFFRYFKRGPAKKGWHFLSEEMEGKLRFPCLIIDPLDGTRELVSGVSECALSLAFYRNKKIQDGYGWIYNPFCGLSVDSQTQHLDLLRVKRDPLLGLVSRSEWEEGLFGPQLSEKIILAPRGSIANKLALLASGSCDFVISLRPKNIWDVAAGSAICASRGIHLFGEKGEIKTLDKIRLSPPLLWCRPDLEDKIKSFLKI